MSLLSTCFNALHKTSHRIILVIVDVKEIYRIMCLVTEKCVFVGVLVDVIDVVVKAPHF